MPSKYLNSLLALIHKAQTTDVCLLVGRKYKDMPSTTCCPNHGCYSCVFSTNKESEQVIKILENST